MTTRWIDLRSDTVTRPTPAMRRAMHDAEVGDDVYGEDPTVNRLQERAASLSAKPSALFVPSGTMGNQIAVRLHTQHGDEAIVEARSHTFNYEMAAMAAFSGVLARPVATRDGILDWTDIEKAIQPPIYYHARTRLISLENTHNMAGGTVYEPSRCEAICREAHARGLAVHLDGARVFNAAAALDVPVSSLCQPFDTVMFCLSKGLCAPVGSILAGSVEAMTEARRIRKLLGGGMRQAGVVAAAGLIALEEMPARLHEDHAHAQFLAEALAHMPGVLLDPSTVRTNIVVFDLDETGPGADAMVSKLREQGVLMGAVGPYRLRAVTHRDVTREDVGAAALVLEKLLRKK